ncbi:MAG TPA: class I SAM-dependent methyltransferase [Candidatus Sulfotelmatobacter sp.]|jgi:23S rRNA (cytosine1962-C5)-methyltransferase|nr:class I SAM-dependent methyltransferase [Candidatus Sulfotelmatobacter sp.]
MKILSTSGWDDYELLDTGNGMRLERFGPYKLIRPDPQIIWRPRLERQSWINVDAVFDAEKKKWIIKKKMPEKWLLSYKNIAFYAKLSPFKHTGVFPEQILQWEWMKSKLRNNNEVQKNLKVLNLFGYTGIASLLCAAEGSTVTHVDASRPTINWARENQSASQLMDKPIRWILDDALKFVQREVKRGIRYDGIIMDPPVYGHGPDGEKWDFNESFSKLLSLCCLVLSNKPLFILVNAYAISSSSLMLENVLSDYVSDLSGTLEVGELALKEKSAGRLLSTGIFARWAKT